MVFLNLGIGADSSIQIFGVRPERMQFNPNTKVQIHDWYYDDGRIDGMYAANNHYPGFPAKKPRHDVKKLKIRTRTHPRKIRLTTNPDTAKEAKHPWTQTQRNYFSFKDFNVR